jgi:dihydrofolate reductase
MGRIVVSEFVSLDGVMADPGGAEKTRHGGWTFQYDRGDEGNAFKVDELMAADALLLGRTTYEGFAAAWPNYGSEDPFSAKMNSIRKYVVSNTLSDEAASWTNTQVVRGDVFAEIAKLREEPGGDLLVAGSGRLIGGLMEHGLVDEYRLMVFPIVLGEGQRMFNQAADATKLVLHEAKTCGDGVVLLTYHAADKKA